WVAASLFFHEGAVSSGRGVVAIDRAAIPAERGSCGWCDAGADLGGLAGKSGRRRAQARTDGRNFLARNALLYGQHAAARYGFGEHVALAGSARAAPGHS